MMAKSVYKAVIFGAGQIGQMTARLLNSPCQLLCFADNDPHKHGSYIGNIPVCSPDAAVALLRIWSSWEFWMKNGVIL